MWSATELLDFGAIQIIYYYYYYYYYYPSDIQCPRTGLGTWQITCLGLKASLTETRDWSPIWGYQGTVQFSFPNNGGAVSGTTRKSAHNSNDANIRGHIFFPLDWTQFIGVDKAFAPVECGSTVKQLIDKGRMMLHDSQWLQQLSKWLVLGR